MLWVEVCGFFEEGIEYTCAYLRDPFGGHLVQGWVRGRDEWERGPLHMHDSPSLHALRLAWERFRARDLFAQCATVREGGARLC